MFVFRYSGPVLEDGSTMRKDAVCPVATIRSARSFSARSRG